MLIRLKNWWRARKSQPQPQPQSKTKTKGLVPAAPAAAAAAATAAPRVSPTYEVRAEGSYVADWTLYGPLDEVSAELLIDSGLDPDLQALQARDLGYDFEGAPDDCERVPDNFEGAPDERWDDSDDADASAYRGLEQEERAAGSTERDAWDASCDAVGADEAFESKFESECESSGDGDGAAGPDDSW